MVSTDLQTHMVSLSEIVPYAGNAKVITGDVQTDFGYGEQQ